MIRYVYPRKITLHTTGKLLKKNASQVRKATGADVVINGTLFEYGAWKPCCDVKQNGKVLVDDKYTRWGLGWNDNDHGFKVDTSANMAKYDNFISCVMLIRNGVLEPLGGLTPDVKRAAGRTAIVGLKDGRIALWVVKEGKNNMTPAQLANAIRNKWNTNIDYCLMLDGGGSSQLSQEGSSYVYAERKVQNYICFWDALEPQEPKGEGNMSATAYSLKADGGKKLATNFKVAEFKCKDGSDTIFIDEKLPPVLQAIRTHFGKAVHINSAYRTEAYNKSVGGAEGSQHLYGRAADIRVDGVSPGKVADYAELLLGDSGGVGRYNTFTHVDVRDVKSRWTSREND